jgi:hypothetical protein
MTKVIILTAKQRATLDRAAQSLLPSPREDFLDKVASRLGKGPGDVALNTAIDAELAVNRLPNFLFTK